MEGEERKTVKFKKMLSNDSGGSILSEDSCIYHHTEIFDQLPSSQICRPHTRQGERVGGAAEEGGPKPGENQHPAPLAGGTKDQALTGPLRSLAVCMQEKREVRARRRLQMRSIGCWESWRRSQSIARKRLWQNVGGAIPRLLPWRHTLHIIEGRFGVGVKAYFVFLRYLVYLNLLHCLIVWSSILEPTRRYGRGNTSEPLVFGGNDSVSDFFFVSGYLERSPLFYGFYTRGSLDLQCLNTPLFFLTGILTLLILSLIMVVRRMTVGYKHTRLLGNRHSFHVSYKVFCGWDYNIQHAPAASLEHSFIRNELKLHLEEQMFHHREAQRTWAQWTRLYFLRVVINVLVLAMLGGAFFLIYKATEVSQRELGKSGDSWVLSVFLHYLAPLTISLVNVVFPHLFRTFSSFEDYSLTTQVNTTLLRSIFLKLACLGMYLFFLFFDNKQECWETHFGKEMYKLQLFDFLACFCNTFFFAFPLKLLGERYPLSCVGRLSRKQCFLIPFNVLDLVYTQTVSWVGVFYCPLLPLLGTAKLVVIFYVKKFMVLRCCVPEQRMFRASSSSVLFHLMLLLGLIMAAVTLGINLYQFPPSLVCGPFAGTPSVFNVTGVCVASLPGPAQTTLNYLSSEAFALPLILAEIVILTSYMSRGRANQKAIERLKEILVMCSSDKRFLVKQHATLLKRRKRSSSTPTGTAEDSPLTQWKDPTPTGSEIGSPLTQWEDPSPTGSEMGSPLAQWKDPTPKGSEIGSPLTQWEDPSSTGSEMGSPLAQWKDPTPTGSKIGSPLTQWEDPSPTGSEMGSPFAQRKDPSPTGSEIGSPLTQWEDPSPTGSEVGSPFAQRKDPSPTGSELGSPFVQWKDPSPTGSEVGSPFAQRKDPSPTGTAEDSPLTQWKDPTPTGSEIGSPLTQWKDPSPTGSEMGSPFAQWKDPSPTGSEMGSPFAQWKDPSPTGSEMGCPFAQWKDPSPTGSEIGD